jgi:TRAP transporter TAXI family solute receptor
MTVVRGFFVLLFLLFAAVALDSGAARAQDSSTGYSGHKPVLAASCRICPWGALADIIKAAMQKSPWNIQVCYICAGAARDARNVENEALAPAYDPSGLYTNYGFPQDELSYLEPPPPKGPMDFGITSSNFLWWGYQGTHDYAGEKPYKDMRLVAMVDAPMYVVVAVTARSGLTDLSQAKGKPVRVLWDLGGLSTAAPDIIAYYGLSKESIEAAGGSVESGRTIKARHDYDIVIYQGDLSEAPEFNLWYQISQQENLKFLHLPDALLTQLMQHDDMVKLTMPAGFLRGVWEPITTVGFLGNVIFGSSDMPDQFAYDLAKAIDDRKDLLATAYEHFSYDPREVWRAYGVPLAPGAARYYREKGYMTGADSSRT